MSEETAIEAETVTVEESADEPQLKPTETVDFWKQKAREQEKKAKENAAARLELDELKASQLSKEEKLAAERDEAARRAAQAEAGLMRWRFASTIPDITDEEVELFLTGTDEETLSRQTQRLREYKMSLKPSKGTHVPGVGNQPNTPASIAEQISAAEAAGNFQLAIALKSQQLAELARNNR